MKDPLGREILHSSVVTYVVQGYMALFFLYPLALSRQGVDLVRTGWLMSGFFLATTLVRPLGSLCAERLGVRRTLLLSGLGMGVASLGLVLPWGFPGILASRLLQGACYGVFMVGLTAYQALVIPPDIRGAAFALVSVGYVMPQITVVPGADLLLSRGWLGAYLMQAPLWGFACAASAFLVPPGLARGRLGQQVAADVAPRQAQAAQAGHQDVGKVLAHALALGQGLQRGGVDLGALAGVAEVAVDAPHQVCRGGLQGPSGREAFVGIAREFGVPGRLERRQGKLRRRVAGLALGVAHLRAHGFPGLAAGQGFGGLGLHGAARGHAQLLVRRLQREMREVVAVEVGALAALARGRGDVDPVLQHGLPGGGARAQAQHMVRRLHRRPVVVAGLVGDVQEHRSGSQAAGGFVGVGEIAQADAVGDAAGRTGAAVQ